MRRLYSTPDKVVVVAQSLAVGWLAKPQMTTSANDDDAVRRRRFLRSVHVSRQKTGSEHRMRADSRRAVNDGDGDDDDDDRGRCCNTRCCWEKCTRPQNRRDGKSTRKKRTDRRDGGKVIRTVLLYCRDDRECLTRGRSLCADLKLVERLIARSTLVASEQSSTHRTGRYSEEYRVTYIAQERGNFLFHASTSGSRLF